MKSIDVDGLPQHAVRTLENMASKYRERYNGGNGHTGKPQEHQPFKLPTFPGRVIGELTREEIYEDV